MLVATAVLLRIVTANVAVIEGARQAGEGSRVLVQNPEQPAGTDAGLKAVLRVSGLGIDRGEEGREVVCRF